MPLTPPIVIRRPFDAHVHARDGVALATTVPHIAEQFGSALFMPNLKPAVRNVKDARAYRDSILRHIPEGLRFNPMMTLYLTGETHRETLAEMADNRSWLIACKLYPAGATTNSSEGIANVDFAFGIFADMERLGIPLCIHAETNHPAVDVFDREKAFIDRHLRRIVETFPNLKVVLEHVTTQEGVQFVESCGPNVAATITAHHLLLNRNALFEGGVRPHRYCLPVLKREEHRRALVQAAISGSPKFFAGTDSAPHAKGTKENACGCAGCYTAPQALALYAEAFYRAGALGGDDCHNGVKEFTQFMSLAGPTFYGLPLAEGLMRITRESVAVPHEYPFGDASVVPLFAGESVNWKAVQVSK